MQGLLLTTLSWLSGDLRAGERGGGDGGPMEGGVEDGEVGGVLVHRGGDDGGGGRVWRPRESQELPAHRLGAA